MQVFTGTYVIVNMVHQSSQKLFDAQALQASTLMIFKSPTKLVYAQLANIFSIANLNHSKTEWPL